MPRPDVIPYPVQNGCHMRAYECHPLADGGMRCEPVLDDDSEKAIAITAIILSIIILLMWVVPLWKERRQRRKEREMFKRWGKNRTNTKED